jgi:hypothetical protein
MPKFTVTILFATLWPLLGAHPVLGQHLPTGGASFSVTKATEYKPLFSLKTNMLYNMALTPNVAAEVPIGRRWSLSAGFMRGWWLERGWAFCWQVQVTELEARYWLRRNESLPVQTGWFVGAFAATGFYDFQLERSRGVQGEITAMGGISGGYLFPLGQAWRLELSAGAGYLLSDYRRYEVVHADGSHVLVKSELDRQLKAIYPLKAGVTLVWVFNRKREWFVDKESITDDAAVDNVATDAATNNAANTPAANETP